MKTHVTRPFTPFRKPIYMTDNKKSLCGIIHPMKQVKIEDILYNCDNDDLVSSITCKKCAKILEPNINRNET